MTNTQQTCPACDDDFDFCTYTTSTERATKQFWAVSDEWKVMLVTGYECPPNNDVWWVPELGYSLSERCHLFATAADARQHGITKLETEIAALQSSLTQLRKDTQ